MTFGFRHGLLTRIVHAGLCKSQPWPFVLRPDLDVCFPEYKTLRKLGLKDGAGGPPE